MKRAVLIIIALFTVAACHCEADQREVATNRNPDGTYNHRCVDK